MANVLRLVQHEKVRLNPDRLNGLFQEAGYANAEHIVGRAVEELAVRLSTCHDLWRAEKWSDLRKCARSLIAISDQIGMTTLARVSADVTQAIDNCDMPAIGATLHRLQRIGERSLTAVWDQQDLSV